MTSDCIQISFLMAHVHHASSITLHNLFQSDSLVRDVMRRHVARILVVEDVIETHFLTESYHVMVAFGSFAVLLNGQFIHRLVQILVNQLVVAQDFCISADCVVRSAVVTRFELEIVDSVQELKVISQDGGSQ